MKKRLVLFDIDGTLIRGGKLWSESFLEILEPYLAGIPLHGLVSFAGRTDTQILRELLEKVGVHQATIEERIPHLQQAYLRRAREQVATRAGEVKVLPGVRALVERSIGHPELAVGLLTGNLREGARMKLEAAGLSEFFDFGLGVYADDHWDRYQMPTIGVAKAREKFGREFRGKEVVIIGDTVHDVLCGRSIGVRTIAVGTGWNIPRSSLLDENPDYFFEDLSDTEKVLSAMLDDLN